MHLRTISYLVLFSGIAIVLVTCTEKKNRAQLEQELQALNLTRGEITLCGNSVNEFGTVNFNLACDEKLKQDFNVATALLHSFEYTEAEKVFAKIMDEDPDCVMAYWGAAMCNFHPQWTPPTPNDLEKGSKIVALARSIISDTSARESFYIEAIATIYDNWKAVDHRTRVLKFEKASQKIYEKYPDDQEAAIFYALALDAAIDPTDKTFVRQKKAGEILNRIFSQEPNHPGIAHYLIHNYDYPEIATLGLDAARRYASIAAASAHAQHMPSHIFIRLGLWDESIKSNLVSVSAAQCYAENIGSTAHWDEELHGLDYLTYAYLQQANDEKALEQINYLDSIQEVFPQNFKDAYAFAAMPARYAIERKDWVAATQLKLGHDNFPWEKFPWEKANVNFGRLLGAVNSGKLSDARKEFEQLQSLHAKLTEAGKKYEANLVKIQLKAGDGWIKLREGQKKEAIKLMTEAADMEDGTSKHPVTPGEIVPARELLGDMLFEAGDFSSALLAYENDLERHPNRFNGLYGAWLSAGKLNNSQKENFYHEKLVALAGSSASDRPQLMTLKSFARK
jgi:hypothetical protein